MNNKRIIDADQWPPGVDAIVIQWCCIRRPGQADMIAKYAGVCATAKGADLVIIREGMHNTTKDRLGNTTRDKRGWHYTAEYRDKKTLNWSTWHHYFIKQGNGSFVVNDQAAVSPNPQFWTNQKGKSSTKTPSRGDSQKIWTWKQAGQQYARSQAI